MRLKHERDARRSPKGLQHMEEHGCLSMPGARSADKATVRFNGVRQGCQGFLVDFAEIQESRVRSDAERLFTQAKKGQIHAGDSRFLSMILNQADRHDHVTKATPAHV